VQPQGYYQNARRPIMLRAKLKTIPIANVDMSATVPRWCR